MTEAAAPINTAARILLRIVSIEFLLFSLLGNACLGNACYRFAIFALQYCARITIV